MRRKLVRQGQNALTVTVPRKWTRTHNLNAGDEVEIREDNISLLISNTNEKRLKTKTIILKKSNKTHLRSVIASAYKAGYNEIVLKIKEPVRISDINEIINSFTGLEFVSQNKDKIVIKSFLTTNEDDINNLIIKMIHVSKLMLNYLKEDWNKVDIDNLKSLQKSNQIKIRDHTLRMIHECRYGGDKSYDYYDFVTILEKLSNSFYHMANYVKTNKVKKSKLVDQIDELLQELGKAYMKKEFYDSNKLWRKLRKSYKNNIDPKSINKLMKKEDPGLVAHYFATVRLYSQLTSRLISLSG
jgi:phosphate uptake regulator